MLIKVLRLLLPLCLLASIGGVPVWARDMRDARIDSVSLASLPSEAVITYRLIQHGGPFPYRRDGIEFQNREHRLPVMPRGYYHEYTVPTPGARDRGARRIITGARAEYFYTDDHYRNFHRIQP